MKNRLVKIASIILSVVAFAFVFVACDEPAKIIDNSVYFDDTINFSTYASTSKKTASLESIVLADDANGFQYTSIDILGIKKWIGGMYIESVTYTFETSAPTTLELDFTIANVKSTDKFNSSLDYYYYSAETSLVIDETNRGSYTFLVNDYISDTKAPQFLLNIDNLCYQTDNSLTIKLREFKVAGFHEE